MEESTIQVHGVSYTLRYERRARGKALYHVFLGDAQVSDKPLPEPAAKDLAFDHWLSTAKLPKRRKPKQIQEIRNSKIESQPFVDNLNRDLEQVDTFLQFTACDFDIGDLGIL